MWWFKTLHPNWLHADLIDLVHHLNTVYHWSTTANGCSNMDCFHHLRWRISFFKCICTVGIDAIGTIVPRVQQPRAISDFSLAERALSLNTSLYQLKIYSNDFLKISDLAKFVEVCCLVIMLTHLFCMFSAQNNLNEWIRDFYWQRKKYIELL